MFPALLLTLLTQAPAVEVGAPHPPLRLPTTAGETLDLRDLLGQKVVVATFASW
jgi:peroxiredoxin